MKKKIVPRGRISAAGYNELVDTANAALTSTESPGDKAVTAGWGTASQFTEVNPLRIVEITQVLGTGVGYLFKELYDPNGDGNYIDSPFGIVAFDNDISLNTPPNIDLQVGCIVIARQNPNCVYRYEMVSKLGCPEFGGSGGSGGSGDNPITDNCTGVVYSLMRYRTACEDGVLIQYSWLETLEYDSTGCLVNTLGEEIPAIIGCCEGSTADCGGGSGGSGGSGGDTGVVIAGCSHTFPSRIYGTWGINPPPVNCHTGSFPLDWNGTAWVGTFSGCTGVITATLTPASFSGGSAIWTLGMVRTGYTYTAPPASVSCGVLSTSVGSIFVSGADSGNVSITFTE